MIELHLHLDGSLSENELNEIKRKFYASEDVPYTPVRFDGRGGLGEYLKCFRYPLLLLRKPESVYFAICALSERLHAQGEEYCEIRFAPALSAGIEGVAEIADAAERAACDLNGKGVYTGIVFCCMRGAPEKENLAVAKTAADKIRNGKGVVGVDLAGDEGRYPNEDYSGIFAFLRESETPFTVHAGEARGAESVGSAILFGARRIGHGVAAASDERVIAMMRERGVLAEMCYTSNLQTGAWKGGREGYPLRKFISEGVKVSLNSDNTAVSGTDLKREYSLLGINGEEARILYSRAFEAAFPNAAAAAFFVNRGKGHL